MDFLKFILACVSNAIGYAVGDVYHSAAADTQATHGLIAMWIFGICAFVLVKVFCLDYEGYPKRDGAIVLAIGISLIIAVIYLAVVYKFFR